jgi:hypothetical protein
LFLHFHAHHAPRHNDNGARQGRRILMIAHLKRTLPFLLIAALAMLPGYARAQLSVPGKLMTYRTVDTDSGEELQRTLSWEATEGSTAVEMTATTYPVGTQVINECIYGNGRARPATSYRSVMRAANGELERSDFDTFDPIYYPFLAQPITADMQPGTCLNRRALDLPTLVGGGQITIWMWSDSGLVGAILQSDGTERITVPAGTFDALQVRVDVDLSKLFPRVPELFLKLVKPTLTLWIAPTEPFYVLKMVGFGSDRTTPHKHTAIELVSISEMNPHDTPIAINLAQADAPGAIPPLKPVNSASFAQGERAGHVTLSSAPTSGGELLVAHVAFNNGLATESRTLIDPHACPITVYLDDRSLAATGAIVRKHLLFFRKAAFPDDPQKELPADLYGGDTTLGLVLPRMLPDDADEASFHVMDFYGQVNQLTIDKQGTTTIALTSDDTNAIYAKLKPIVDIPFLLRPLAYFFIPTFDAYFDTDPSHRLLKFEGPLGPPGVPNATMIADEKPPSAQRSH